MTALQFEHALRAHAKKLLALADALAGPAPAFPRLRHPEAQQLATSIEYRALELLSLATQLLKHADQVSDL